MTRLLVKTLLRKRINLPGREISLQAPAKLNLYLNVLNRRRDGYHNISTIMQKVTLFDSLSLRLNGMGRIRLFCSNTDLVNNDNSVFRAAEIIKKEHVKGLGVDIFLKKRIPIGGGLGGASSDAAAVLLGLNKLCQLRLDYHQLMLLGSEIGSDVNFFILPNNFAEAFGRGDKVNPLASALSPEYLLILTGEIISTKEIYSSFKPGLTKYLDNAKLIKYSLENEDMDLLKRLFFNNLTAVYFSKSGIAGKVFGALADIKGCSFFLSGSGSTVAVLIDSSLIRQQAESAMDKLGVKYLKVKTVFLEGGGEEKNS